MYMIPPAGFSGVPGGLQLGVRDLRWQQHVLGAGSAWHSWPGSCRYKAAASLMGNYLLVRGPAASVSILINIVHLLHQQMLGAAAGTCRSTRSYAGLLFVHFAVKRTHAPGCIMLRVCAVAFAGLATELHVTHSEAHPAEVRPPRWHISQQLLLLVVHILDHMMCWVCCRSP